MLSKYLLVFLFVVGYLGLNAKSITVALDGRGDFKSIQAAIESLPKESSKLRTIRVKAGLYFEKIYIDKGNIAIEGEEKPIYGSGWTGLNSSIKGVVILDAIARDIWRCSGHDTDWGAAVVNVQANDINLKNLTIVNTYGFENNETSYINCEGITRAVRYDGHQFALRCMPTTQRFQAQFCNFHAIGGDTVSPWDVDNGTFYFKGCTMEGGVDFYCPRGWAYAEDCHFICHNKNAAIWHDGTSNESAKSVLKNCTFTGDEGFKLGRYHRPAQIYMINCTFGKEMADADIYQVNPQSEVAWGHRIYYFNCKKEGEPFTFYQDNLNKDIAKKINKDWTLKARWNKYDEPTTQNNFALPKTIQIDTIAEQMLLVQLSNGGWPKTLDGKIQPIPYDKRWTNDFIQKFKKKDLSPLDATIDNNATSKEIEYLASAYEKTKNVNYRYGAERGIKYLLQMQYANGGFPQYYPDTTGYYQHITYNDNAMINAVSLLRDVAKGNQPFSMVGSDLMAECKQAVDKAITCILNTQVEYQGVKTIWGAQHDHNSLLPAKARKYEHPSLTASESSGIIKFLFEIENPSQEVKDAINAAMIFMDKIKLIGVKTSVKAGSKKDIEVIDDSTAPPLWARFYDLESLKPIFSGRDGIIKYDIAEIEEERRSNYRWYGDWPNSLWGKYEKWYSKNGKKNTKFLTFVTDTSYNLNTVLTKTKSQTPNFQFVSSKNFKNVRVDKNIPYLVNGDQSLTFDRYDAKNAKLKKSITIVLIHGGGWRTGSKEMMCTLATDLSSEGYTCIAPNYTLSTHGLYPTAVDDINNLLNQINAKVGGKIYLLGFSAGGQLASLVAQKKENPKINGLIDLDGVMALIHPDAGEGSDFPKTSSATMWLGSGKLSNPSLWNEASALTHAGKNSPPTLIIGSSVKRMTAGSKEYCDILKKQNISCEILTFDDAPHNFIYFEPWYTPLLQNVKSFIQITNKLH